MLTLRDVYRYPLNTKKQNKQLLKIILLPRPLSNDNSLTVTVTPQSVLWKYTFESNV